MSSQPPAAPGRPEMPAHGSLRCPRCSAMVGPEQDWCLECGAPARTRLAQTPNWQLPTVAIGAIILIAGAMLAFAFVKLTNDGGAPAATIAPAGMTTTAPTVAPPVVAPPATTPPPATTLPQTTPTTPTTTATTPGRPALPPTPRTKAQTTPTHTTTTQTRPTPRTTTQTTTTPTTTTPRTTTTP